MQQLSIDLGLTDSSEVEETKNTTEIELHEFQKRTKKTTYDLIRQGKRQICIIAPPGFGKTILSGDIIKDTVSRSKRCLLLLDRECLINQTPEEYELLGLNSLVYQGKRAKFWDKHQNSLLQQNIVIASIQTIESRLRRGLNVSDFLGHFDWIHVDEAHLLCYRDSYRQIRDEFLTKGSGFILYTGTPWRLSKEEYLGQWADCSVIGAQPPELVKARRLAPCRMFGIGDYFDLSQLDEEKGDYTEKSIELQATTESALRSALENFKKYCMTFGGEVNRISIGFCATINQCKILTETFNQAGIAADWIEGDHDSDERKQKYKDLLTRKNKILFAVGTLGVGVNLPPVDSILFLRPTKSKALFHQSACRGARVFPGKEDFLLLDFGDNITKQKFGSPVGYQNYSIEQQKKPPVDFVMHKECPVKKGGCGALVSIFARVCPECGYEFAQDSSADSPEELEQEDFIELVEILDGVAKKKIKFLRQHRKRCFKEDLDPMEPARLFYQEFGHEPPIDWYYQSCLGKKYSTERLIKFREYIRKHEGAAYWSWFNSQMLLEFGSPQKRKEEEQRAVKAEEARRKREEKKQQRQKEQEEWWQRVQEWARNWDAHRYHYQYKAPDSTHEFNWWNTLGVSISSTWKDVKNKYRELAKEFHPDHYPPDSQEYFNATEKMKKINQAYEIAKACLKKN